MINLDILKKLTFLSLFVLALSCMTSCGEDDVEGCMDPTADNFNPEATISDGSCTYSGCTDEDAVNYDPQATDDDGSCVYARDKFIGDYEGSFICPGILALISADTVAFTIAPGLDASLKNEVIVTLFNVGGLTIDLTATAVGDELMIDAELLGVPIQGVTGNVTGTGSAVLDASGDILTANIQLTVSIPLLGINDTQTCVLVGMRQ